MSDRPFRAPERTSGVGGTWTGGRSTDNRYSEESPGKDIIKVETDENKTAAWNVDKKGKCV